MSDHKPAVLRNLRIKRVALVDSGANFDLRTGDGSHVMLFKSAKEPVNKETPVKKSLLKRMFEAFREPDAVKQDAALTSLEKEFGEDDKTELHKADDPMCKCADCVAKRATAVDGVEKRMTDLEKRAVAAETRAENAEKVAKGVLDTQERSEVVSILKSFTATPIDLTTDVDHYLLLKRTNPALFDRQIAILKATDVHLAASKMFTDVGTRKGAGEGSAWAQIEAKAEALVTKSPTKMTKAQAIDEILQDPTNFKLVKQYRAEAQ